MMTSVSGKRGIGKTYHLAKEVYEHYKQGCLCITNFAHVYSHIDCSKENPEVLYDIIRELGVFKEKGYELCDLFPTFLHSGVFIALDEAHLYFSADLFKRYATDDKFQYLLKFLAQARKSDVEIWYSTQDPAKIDKNWRRFTEDWVRYMPLLPIYFRKMVLKERRGLLPYYRREIRYLLPVVWEEHHHLDHENPQFDYAFTENADGILVFGKKTTLQWRKLRLSGWLDPFPYKLYDSFQMLAMQGDPEGQTFEHLKHFAFTEETMRRERFPTFKRMFRMPLNDAKMPIKRIFKDLELPEIDNRGMNQNVLAQPVEFLDSLSFINSRRKKQFWKATGGAVRARAPEAEAAAGGA